MRIFATVLCAAACAWSVPPALAQTGYLGLSATSSGETYTNFPAAAHVESNNAPWGRKLYGGINWTDQFALEAGYGAFGTWKTANPGTGPVRDVRGTAQLLYGAGKYTVAVGDAFSVFGKVGVARNGFTIDYGAQSTTHASFVRPMAGVGASYSVTSRLAAVLEYDYYGAEDHFRQQKVELGLKYGF